MTREEYIKKAEEILVSYHDNYCQTEGCKDCRKYRKLILQALYQLYTEGVKEIIGEDESTQPIFRNPTHDINCQCIGCLPSLVQEGKNTLRAEQREKLKK